MRRSRRPRHKARSGIDIREVDDPQRVGLADAELPVYLVERTWSLGMSIGVELGPRLRNPQDSEIISKSATSRVPIGADRNPRRAQYPIFVNDLYGHGRGLLDRRSTHADPVTDQGEASLEHPKYGLSQPCARERVFLANECCHIAA